jgi:hypothetical protein
LEQNYGEKQYIPRAFIERRKVKDRRSCLELEEYFSQNPERRVNMIKRRMLGDRREWLSGIMNTFRDEDL